jgi:urocanate hydratase
MPFLDFQNHSMTEQTFKAAISAGIPQELPAKKSIDSELSHAPKRKDILSEDEKKLALRNALRYFPKEWHKELVTEFKLELDIHVQIYA